MGDAAERPATETLFRARAGKEADVPFVLERWLQAYKATSDGREEAFRNPGFVSRWKGRARKILVRSELRVACDLEEEDAIMGFAVLVPAVALLYFVYVLPEARRLGVARMLLGDLAGRDVVYTHRPMDRAVAWPANWVFDRSPNYV